MPKIASVQVAVARVPLDVPTSFSTRTVTERHYCLVKVRSTEGVQGIGFCYVGSKGGDVAKVAVQQLLAPLLIGQDSHRSEGLWNQMYQEALLQGRSGSVMRGISILDTALWDLNARSVKLPLHDYLGCLNREKVIAYASGGYYVDGKTPADLGREMARYVEMGYSAVKMKTGRLSPAEEEKRVAAARDAIGPDVVLMLDVNNGWSDLPTAIEYARRFEAYNPYWLEEPFLPDAIDLPRFRHPYRAAYVLGPEKGSLSPELIARCTHIVRIPTRFCVNVAIAAAVVMYDRIQSSSSAPRLP